MVEWLGTHGVTEIVLACGFLPDQLREALGDGEHGGVKLTYVTEPERRGTAGAIRFAAEALGDGLEDRFLALNGDVLTDLDLGALLRAHEERGARATIGLYGVEDSSAFGLVECDAAGAVLDFREKTGEAVPGSINAGAYVLAREGLDLIPPGQQFSIETEVFPRLVGEGLCALPLSGYWMDIGVPERYLQATWDILEGRVDTGVRPTAPGLFVGADCAIAESARLGPRAVLAGGCRVGAEATISGSVVLEGCTVGERAVISDSIIAADTVVEPGARVEGTTVAAHERV